MDSSSLRFLAAAALRQREEEERKQEMEEKRRLELEEAEEERMLELNRRVSADLPLTQAETEAWRRWILLPPRQRKRKKRRKRNTPRTSSNSSCGGQSSSSRRRHDRPLPSGWRRADDASGRVYYWHVNTRQTRWTPPVSDDEDEGEEDEADEEVEDEDMDEIYAGSRFPAGFLPMRMCLWFPSGNCRQGSLTV